MISIIQLSFSHRALFCSWYRLPCIFYSQSCRIWIKTLCISLRISRLEEVEELLSTQLSTVAGLSTCSCRSQTGALLRNPRCTSPRASLPRNPPIVSPLSWSWYRALRVSQGRLRQNLRNSWQMTDSSALGSHLSVNRSAQLSSLSVLACRALQNTLYMHSSYSCSSSKMGQRAISLIRAAILCESWLINCGSYSSNRFCEANAYTYLRNTCRAAVQCRYLGGLSVSVLTTCSSLSQDQRVVSFKGSCCSQLHILARLHLQMLRLSTRPSIIPCYNIIMTQPARTAPWSTLLVLVLFSWGLKLLLLPAYYSTDFHVHQNWLRITSQLPLAQWYYDTASKWTLDYPPLFAYFEHALSLLARLLHPGIVTHINEDWPTVVFQRTSVMVTDLAYLWVLLRAMGGAVTVRLVIAYLWIPFILLDNIHFQYNLMMQAILVLSVWLMNQRKYIKSAFTFSVLLNFKHIYLYAAPAFFIYLLKAYVFNPNCNDKEQEQSVTDSISQDQQDDKSWIHKLVKVGTATIVPFIVSFGPFLVVGGIEGIKQILARLFPFSRGLVHEYWAPNFWAIYYSLDKLLYFAGFKMKIASGFLEVQPNSTGVNTLRVLPEVTATTTLVIILVCLAPIVITFFLSPKRPSFALLTCICGFTFFFFGFHVHQKAITPYINLLFIMAPGTPILNAAAYVNIINLLPLLILPGERALCIVLSLLWLSLWEFIDKDKRSEMVRIQEQLIRHVSFSNARQVILLCFEYLIEISGLLITLYHFLVHPLLRRPNLEFLPLLMNSLWAAIFNMAWTGFLYLKFINDHVPHGALK